MLEEKITLAQIIEKLKINKGVTPYNHDTFEVEEFIDETNS